MTKGQCILFRLLKYHLIRSPYIIKLEHPSCSLCFFSIFDLFIKNIYFPIFGVVAQVAVADWRFSSVLSCVLTYFLSLKQFINKECKDQWDIVKINV